FLETAGFLGNRGIELRQIRVGQRLQRRRERDRGEQRAEQQRARRQKGWYGAAKRHHHRGIRAGVGASGTRSLPAAEGRHTDRPLRVKFPAEAAAAVAGGFSPKPACGPHERCCAIRLPLTPALSPVCTGEMVDTCSGTWWTLSGQLSAAEGSVVKQVQLCNAHGGPVDVQIAFVGELPHDHWLTDEGFAHTVGVALPMDSATVLHPTYPMEGLVLGLSRMLAVLAGAGAVVLCRYVQGQGVVRAFAVVDAAPAIESLLGRVKVLEVASLQHLGLEAAVEALILALGLRMVGARMAYADALLHQPHVQSGIGGAGVAPGRAVVHGHARG